MYKFVFSEKAPHRYIRHVIFWLVWGTYFFASMNFLPPQTNAPPRPEYSIWNLPEFIHLLLVLCVHILACYGLIYFILPRYLLKARYFSFLGGTLLLTTMMILATRVIDTVIIPALKDSTNNFPIPFYSSIFSGLISAIKIIAVAAAIKLVKHWWMKQKEKERLEKQKIQTDLQLLKSQIHPSFLFSTLNNINSFALKASPKAPEMLLKLSDILSYMLYECNDHDVLLEKELKMLNDYMVLEKIRYNGSLDMNVQVKGDISNKRIAPLLLLRFIENGVKQCNNSLTEKHWINLELQIEKHVLYMKLMHGKSPTLQAKEKNEDDELAQVQKRLQLLYPGMHHLRIMDEPEIMMIILEIDLNPMSVDDKNKMTSTVAETEALINAN
jgi:sensor histidine kinase YesM